MIKQERITLTRLLCAPVVACAITASAMIYYFSAHRTDLSEDDALQGKLEMVMSRPAVEAERTITYAKEAAMALYVPVGNGGALREFCQGPTEERKKMYARIKQTYMAKIADRIFARSEDNK